jgi:putative spermidine/putrescine transport system permease protein
VGWLLTLPALAFLVYAFVIPIAAFLFQVVDNRAPHAQLRNVAVALADWDRRGMPGDAAFKAVADDLRRLVRDEAVVSLAARLNHNKAGLRSLITRTAARLPASEPASWRETLTAIDARWNDPETWRILASESGPVTWHYLLAALDLQRGADGGLTNVAEDQRIYRGLFMQTVVISAVVTLLCLAIGLPIAYVLAHGSARLQNVLLVFVLLPFWSSLLVRSAGWIVVLHEQGLLNYALSWLGFGERATSMLYNRPGVYLAMTHVLLPFMILPIYSVMRGIPDTHLKAAASLGAPPWLAFRRAYLPQILPGVVAGSTLVFVSALGYYITPLLIGGPRDQMISYFIAYFTNVSVNWGMAGALSLILLASVVVIYAIIGRLIGFDRIRTG